MAWRILLTVVYAIACGAVFALDNLQLWPGGEAFSLVVLAAGLVVGFLVGRWWVLLAVLGGLIGRTIGWGEDGHDGNPALWWPYIMSTVLFFGTVLVLGLLVSVGYGSRGSASDSRSARRTGA